MTNTAIRELTVNEIDLVSGAWGLGASIAGGLEVSAGIQIGDFMAGFGGAVSGGIAVGVELPSLGDLLGGLLG